MRGLVIVDASPLIGLTIVDGLEWLHNLFGTVYIPESVKHEVLSGKVSRGEQAIADAIKTGWLKIWLEPVEDRIGFDLDKGETDCINIALAQKQKEAVLLIMDERAGRAVAIEKGLQITGTAALIGAAKQHGLIDSAREVFEVLHQSDFRISADVIRHVLTSVDEV